MCINIVTLKTKYFFLICSCSSMKVAALLQKKIQKKIEIMSVKFAIRNIQTSLRSTNT